MMRGQSDMGFTISAKSRGKREGRGGSGHKAGLPRTNGVSSPRPFFFFSLFFFYFAMDAPHCTRTCVCVCGLVPGEKILIGGVLKAVPYAHIFPLCVSAFLVGPATFSPFTFPFF